MSSVLPRVNAEVINTSDDPMLRPALVTGSAKFGDITQSVCGVTEGRPTKAWWIALGISGLLLLNLVAMLGYLVVTGIGVWGNNVPVSWAFDITNFVFWIGIGHAGTLISAILFLFRQKWRTGINRFAEAMTIFAVICALIFPMFHVGRIWVMYFLFPIPNQYSMWPNFRSPLLWDVFAVTTYFIVSLCFWFMGLVPDFATLRDRAKTKIRRIVMGILAMGWRGSNRQWLRFEKAYLLLAGLATPLGLSVHSVVSFDFATSVIPGWHTTIFPPYFVAGAIFGGFAMVLTLAIPSRQFFGLKHIITMHHLENCNKIILATSMMVGYAYMVEFFTAWYSGNPTEHFAFINRALGPYWWAYWLMILFNVLSPQIFWFKKLRTSIPAMIIVAICVDIGMWFERFVIIVTSLSRDYLPSSWGLYAPTWVDIMTFLGTLGLFMFLFLLFVRFLPMVAMAEVKSVMPEADAHVEEHDEHRPLGDYWGDAPKSHEERMRAAEM